VTGRASGHRTNVRRKGSAGHPTAVIPTRKEGFHTRARPQRRSRLLQRLWRWWVRLPVLDAGGAP
jgi:hypothetical protein